MKPIRLSVETEVSLLKAVMDGYCSHTILHPREISREGRVVLRSIQKLLKSGATPPLTSSSVCVIAQKFLGGDKTELTNLFQAMNGLPSEEGQALVRIMQEKALATKIFNEVGNQMSKDAVDFGYLRGLLQQGEASQESTAQQSPLTPISSCVGSSFPASPTGIPLPSLPTISGSTNGVHGLWVLGGRPGLGKSTLAWQIGVELHATVPVVFYDLDGTGIEWLLDRMRQICKDDLDKFRCKTERFYVRDNIGGLDNDLEQIPAPALIIIDSAQTLPTREKYRRIGIDQWLADFKALTQKGYTVLVVSEMNRSMYDEASMTGYKESGTFEYAGSLCAQLLKEEDDLLDEAAPVEFHILKGKHVKSVGHITNLERVKKKAFWFEEVE